MLGCFTKKSASSYRQILRARATTGAVYIKLLRRQKEKPFFYTAHDRIREREPATTTTPFSAAKKPPHFCHVCPHSDSAHESISSEEIIFPELLRIDPYRSPARAK